MKRLSNPTSFMKHFGRLVATEVFDSPIEGKGLRSVANLNAGQVIGFYGGKKFPSAQVWADSGATDGRYLFYIGNGEVIDGKRSKLGRINHSCEPNTAAVPVVIGDQAEVMFLTQRAVAAGEELTIDYNIHDPEGDKADLSKWVCRCSTPQCRGWMWSPETLAANGASVETSVFEVPIPPVDGLHVQLETVDGRYGSQVHDVGCRYPMLWSAEGDGEVCSAVITQFQDGVEVESLEMTGAAWREFEKRVDWQEFAAQAQREFIETLVRGYVDEYGLMYEHAKCNSAWEAKHSCSRDASCPVCGTAVPPLTERLVRRLSDDTVADLETA